MGKHEGSFNSLITSTFIGIGAIVGSGWLFASYYASKVAGPAAIFSWIIGAVLALFIALLLAEIATMFPITGLFGRLLVVSHNRDMGFVVAISNWAGVLLMIPSEAEATAQYISTVFPSLTPYLFVNQHFTLIGTLVATVLVILYTLANYWGIKSLGKVNNAITVIKIVIPTLAGILFIIAQFEPSHFTQASTGGFMPFGVSSIFSAIVGCGIFYAFYGFQYIAAFASEFKNASKIIPIALVSSVAICLGIYLLLQASFIGAVPNSMLANGGWHGINFTSPLAQLAIILGLNFFSVVLYLDACLSPSGTGVVYLGAASRMMAGMAKDKQIPTYFSDTHPVFNFSRRSLLLSSILSIAVMFIFKSWQSIVELVTVFQILACVAVPVALYKLRLSKPNLIRPFRMKFGLTLSVIVFLLMTYLITLAGFKAVLTNFILHVTCFTMYVSVYHKGQIAGFMNACYSSWSIFAYMAFTCVATYIHDFHPVLANSIYGNIVVFLIALVLFYLMIYQKSYGKEEASTIHS